MKITDAFNSKEVRAGRRAIDLKYVKLQRLLAAVNFEGKAEIEKKISAAYIKERKAFEASIDPSKPPKAAAKPAKKAALKKKAAAKPAKKSNGKKSQKPAAGATAHGDKDAKDLM